ncbi:MULTISPECIES: FAD-dependent oxidoreductase [Rhodanobacter]|uniref:FAD-dependent oxidoreductase n=3 Tax=Rhodanobacteraceae TaxID=1775411 RepID=UPI00091DCC6D|nr:FAD-dependent oxidoreductase [Rhodanobacter thiooxydans]TAN18948.1 MAG: FAD-dependent oxidoreductase [Rhodanobacter sp.]UJJ55532.1 FAD-dependent oxidoreductase [Rhodanobacter thiooxydans]
MSRSLERCAVAVVGAGVAGLCAATALLEAGATVSVHERADAVGASACSWLAGGMLAPDCEREGAETVVAERGRLALDWWSQHVPGVVRGGTLVLAAPRDRGELRQFAARTGGHVAVDAERIATLEPDLAEGFSEGLWLADEAHLDPREALPALAASLASRGVRFAFGAAVQPQTLAADHVIDCRGLAAREALPDLRGVRGERLLLRSRDVTLHRPVRLLHPRFSIYVVPRADGLLMLGATMLESDHAGPITVRSALELLGAARALHPALAEAEIVEAAAGVRPAFPDNLPRLLRRGRVTHFNGLYRHGFLLAPWYATQLAATLAAPAEVEA